MPKTQLTVRARGDELASSPGRREPDGALQLPGRGARRRAHVETHGDVRAEAALDFSSQLGCEPVDLTVVDRAEGHTVVVEPVDGVAKGEDLESAGVREDRPAPAHEAVEPSQRLDRLVARPEVQVVGVREDDRRTEIGELVRVDALDGALRADGHEHGCFHLSVRGREHAGARRSLLCHDPEHQRTSIASPKE